MDTAMTHGAGDVLVVDDDPAIIELIVDLLTYEGYAVRTAMDGAAALTALRAQAPTVLLSDLRMTGLPIGMIIQAARRAYADLPIGIITASPERAVPFLSDRSITCIAKPFDLTVLLAWVEQYLEPRARHVNGYRRRSAATERAVWRPRAALSSARTAPRDVPGELTRRLFAHSAALHASATTIVARSEALCTRAAMARAHSQELLLANAERRARERTAGLRRSD